MSAPAKPWEQTRFAQSRILNSSAPMQQTITIPVGRLRTNVPPLPPRPVTSNLSSQYNGYNSSYYSSYGRSGYSPYGYSGYGGMGGIQGGYGAMYGGYGGMGGGMYGPSSYGMGAESRFIQLAEESTRPAFQGIESLVHAFGSIAMMLDSTFFAVTSSFRAVLGVAENFGRIRSMFGQIWSSFALFRALNWLYRKLLAILGIKKMEDIGRQAWSQAMEESVAEGAQNVSSWPIFMFLGMIISAPYLISRLLPPLEDKRDPKNWTSPGRPALVGYPFQASSQQELSVSAGERIMLAPQAVQEDMKLFNTGWVYAQSERGLGLVPLNYLQAVNVQRPDIQRPDTVQQVETNEQVPVQSSEPITVSVPAKNDDVPASSQEETKENSQN